MITNKTPNYAMRKKHFVLEEVIIHIAQRAPSAMQADVAHHLKAMTYGMTVREQYNLLAGRGLIQPEELELLTTEGKQ